MAIPKNVKKYLDKKMTKYEAIAHKTVYTAYDAAQTLRRELKEIGKNLMIAADKAYVIAVLPAHMRVDLGKLKKAIGAKKVSIPNEKMMIKIFKVKPGTMTAFGGLHKVEVWADKSLLKTKEIILSAGSFTDSIRLRVKDFIEMEKAKLADFAQSGGYKLQVKSKKKAKSKPKKRAIKKTARRIPENKVVKKRK